MLAMMIFYFIFICDIYFLFFYRTLLHYLSYVNHPEIVSYLVEKNLCDFSFDANGESPLSLAVREKNFGVTSVYLTMFGPEILENGEELIEIALANKDEKTLEGKVFSSRNHLRSPV